MKADPELTKQQHSLTHVATMDVYTYIGIVLSHLEPLLLTGSIIIDEVWGSNRNQLILTAMNEQKRESDIINILAKLIYRC